MSFTWPWQIIVSNTVPSVISKEYQEMIKNKDVKPVQVSQTPITTPQGESQKTDFEDQSSGKGDPFEEAIKISRGE